MGGTRLGQVGEVRSIAESGRMLLGQCSKSNLDTRLRGGGVLGQLCPCFTCSRGERAHAPEDSRTSITPCLASESNTL